jgi:enoyl-CoA hydratase/carnithine racemase
MYQGKSLKVVVNQEEQIAELIFDREGESINKFDARTIKELGEAGAALASAHHLKGLLVTSAKDGFIVGADITEFGSSAARKRSPPGPGKPTRSSVRSKTCRSRASPPSTAWRWAAASRCAWRPTSA